MFTLLFQKGVRDRCDEKEKQPRTGKTKEINRKQKMGKQPNQRKVKKKVSKGQEREKPRRKVDQDNDMHKPGSDEICLLYIIMCKSKLV